MWDMHHDTLVRDAATVRRLRSAMAKDDLLVGAQLDIIPGGIARTQGSGRGQRVDRWPGRSLHGAEQNASKRSDDDESCQGHYRSTLPGLPPRAICLMIHHSSRAARV